MKLSCTDTGTGRHCAVQVDTDLNLTYDFLRVNRRACVQNSEMQFQFPALHCSQCSVLPALSASRCASGQSLACFSMHCIATVNTHCILHSILPLLVLFCSSSECEGVHLSLWSSRISRGAVPRHSHTWYATHGWPAQEHHEMAEKGYS